MPEVFAGSIVPDCSDLDPHIIQYVDNFALTQLVSVNKRFVDLVQKAKPARKIAAPDSFTWFIAAIIAGSTNAVGEHLKRFPNHVNKMFNEEDYEDLFLWTELVIPGIDYYQYIQPIDVAVETKNEDMVLKVLSFGGSGIDCSPKNCMFMPRVVARHCCETFQIKIITYAFENENLEFLDKLYELIPETLGWAASHSMELQQALTAAQNECNFAKCKWAIDHVWVPLNNVLRIFNQHKQRKLVAALKKLYHA